MRLLPDGRYEITNKQTGEKKVVRKEELPMYGLSPQETSNTNSKSLGQKVKDFITNALPDVGAFAGSMAKGKGGVALGAMGGGLGVLGKGALKAENPFENFGKNTEENFIKPMMNMSPGERIKASFNPMTSVAAITNPLVDIFGKGKEEAPLEKLIPIQEYPEFMQKTTEGAVMGLAGMGFEKLGAKVAGPALSKIGWTKFLKPEKFADDAMSETYKIIDEGLSSSTEKISITPMLEKLLQMKERAIKELVPGAPERIDGVIKRIGKYGEEITAAQAQSIKNGFNREIYGEAEKKLLSRGAGVYEKEAKEVTAGSLSEGVRDAFIKDGLTDANEAYKIYHRLGLISADMKRPFANFWKAGIPAVVTGGAIVAGGGPVSVAVPAITAMMIMPWTRYAVRKALGEVLTPATGTIIKGLTIPALNEMFKGKQ